MSGGNQGGTVDGRNPANQLRLVKSHDLQGFSTIPGGAGFQPSTVSRGVWQTLPENKDDRQENHHYLTGDISSNAWGNPASHVSFSAVYNFLKLTASKAPANSNSWCR